MSGPEGESCPCSGSTTSTSIVGIATALFSCTDSSCQRLCPNREAAGRHRQGDRGLHPPAQGGSAELHRAVPVSQGKDAVVQRARGAAVLLLLWLPGFGRRVFSLWARSRTSAFPRRCGSWRRSAAFRCPSGSFRRRRRRPERGCGRSCWTCTRPRRRGLRSSCAARKGRWRANTLAGRGLTAEGIRKFRIGYAPDSFNALRDRLSGMADEETLRASGLFSSKEQGDGRRGRSTTGSASG